MIENEDPLGNANDPLDVPSTGNANDPLDGLLGDTPEPTPEPTPAVPINEPVKKHKNAGKPGFDPVTGRRFRRGEKGYVRQYKENAHLEKAWRMEMDCRRPVVPKFIPDEKGILHPVNVYERSIIKKLAQGGSVKDISRETGTEVSKINALLKTGQVQEYLRNVLLNAGITDELLAQRLREGLDATTKREFLTKTGEVITGEEKPDLEQRRNYMRDAFQLKGYMGKLAGEGGDDGKGGGGNTFNLFQTIVNARKERGLPPEGEIIDVQAQATPSADPLPAETAENGEADAAAGAEGGLK
jgi:hypothetical protein